MRDALSLPSSGVIMPTAVENLETARDNIATKIAEISANPKPSYSVDGQSVSHSEYLKTLLDSFQLLQEQIIAMSPYEHVSQVL